VVIKKKNDFAIQRAALCRTVTGQGAGSPDPSARVTRTLGTPLSKVAREFDRAFHSALYLALQQLRARPVARYIKRLGEWQSLAPAEFQNLVADRLLRALEQARQTAPWYAQGQWSKASSQELSSWPILERETLRAHVQEFRASALPLGSFERHSSGSTGPPLRILIDPAGAAWSWASEYRALLWHEIPVGVRTLMLWGGSHPVLDWLRNRTLFRTTELTPETLARAADWILRCRPVLGWGHPSAFVQLARFIAAEYGEIGDSWLPFVKLGGEQVFPFQREQISRMLGARCIESYGCTEVGAIAGECPAGSLHVYAEHVHIEIMRGDQPVRAGEYGDIVATSLTNRAMPVVRCRIGDRGRLLPEPCSCGLPLPVLADLQGRVSDLLLAADGRPVHGSALGQGLRELLAEPTSSSVREVLFEQQNPMHWRVLVETSGSLHAAAAEAFQRLVRELFGADCRVDVTQVVQISREASGKYRYYRAVKDAASLAPDQAVDLQRVHQPIDDQQSQQQVTADLIVAEHPDRRISRPGEYQSLS
jgi:phenylacetate-CoA ligase